MKVFQQNIFGGEDEVITEVPAIVFKNRHKEGRYLPESMDLGDPDDDDLDITIDEIENALIVVSDDLTTPDEKDVQKVRDFFKSIKFALDFDVVDVHYEPVHVKLTIEQYNEVAERNGWELIK